MAADTLTSERGRHVITPAIRARVRHIELRTRGLVESLFSGEYHSVFKGRGLEFSDVREYQPGDDIRTIDWNVTARRGRVYVKELVEDRQLSVLLIVDLSGSKRFGTGPDRNARLAGEISAILGLAATANNDSVGLLLVTDRVELFVPPDTGRRHAMRLVTDVLSFQPVGTGTHLSTALEFAAKVLRQRTIVFLVSDFLIDEDTDPSFEHAARRLGSEHDLVPVRLTDPRSGTLPDVGMLATIDPESGERQVIDTGRASVREAFERRFAFRRKAVSDTFARLALDSIEVSTPDDYVPPMVAFFRRRARVT